MGVVPQERSSWLEVKTLIAFRESPGLQASSRRNHSLIIPTYGKLCSPNTKFNVDVNVRGLRISDVCLIVTLLLSLESMANL